MAEEENKTKQEYHFAAPSKKADTAPVGDPVFQPAKFGEPNKDIPKEKLSEFTDNILRFGRSQYAIGLFWQPLQDVDDPIPEIRETMESDANADLYATHFGRAPQYGIGSTKKGLKAGLIVGAIALLDALSERSSFVAVFKVPNGWWFVAARNDLILPEEDVLYHTEEEAKEAFTSMLTVPDWGYKIAPSSWNLDDTEEMDLEKLLKEGQVVRLLTLGAMRGMKILFIIAILTIALIGAGIYFAYNFFNKEKETPTTIEPIAPLVTIQAQEPQREEEKPWEKLVSVPALLSRCWSDAYQLKTMNVPGWGLNQIVCTPTGIQTGWNKKWTKAGRVAWVESAIRDQYKFKGEALINETGTAATIAFKFDDLPIIASNPTLTVAKIRRELTDISQALSLPISMSVGQISVELPKPPSEDGKNDQNQDYVRIYKYLAFSFTSSMDPPAWETFFDKFNGLEVTKIEYNPNSSSALTNNWKYEGRIYANEK